VIPQSDLVMVRLRHLLTIMKLPFLYEEEKAVYPYGESLEIVKKSNGIGKEVQLNNVYKNLTKYRKTLHYYIAMTPHVLYHT
jgi:hypothetical protein